MNQQLTHESLKGLADQYGSPLYVYYAESIKQQYEKLKNHKTPILFIMTMSTKEADQAAARLPVPPRWRGKRD